MAKSLKFRRVAHQIVILLVIAYFIIFSTISLHRYWQYAIGYYDFGIFYSAISAVAQGREPIIDHFIFTGQNILGDHFHPLIFLASPFMALFPGGETLLIFQAGFVALSGVFVYFLAKEVVKNELEAVFLLIIYFSFIGLHNALITEFHEITLLPLPLSIFFYGMVSKHKKWYLLGLLGTLLVKETVFIIPAWFGLLLALRGTGEWKRIGQLTCMGSILYFLLVIFVIIPGINGASYYYLHDTVQKSTVLSFDALTLQSIGNTFITHGLLPLLAPSTLLPVLFNWWSRLTRFGNFDLGGHYNAELAPTLLLGAVFGWQKLKKFWQKLAKKFFGKTILAKSHIVLAGIVLFSLVWNIYILKSPVLLFFNRDFYAHTQNLQFLNELIEEIPGTGSVMAQSHIAAKLAYRQTYMLRENYQDFSPDYIILDTREGQEPSNFLGISDYQQLVTNIENDPAYELYYQQGEQRIYVLLY